MQNKPNLEEKQALALKQGEAYTAALDLMKKIDVHAEGEVDDYIVTLACEKAEGVYKVQPGGDLQWQIPFEHQNQHLEIVVRDRKDLRFVPELSVSVSLAVKGGNEILSIDLPFLWHPFLYHYGADVHITEEDNYVAIVTIQQPTFGRHDEDKGKRYSRTSTITLGPVHLKPGRKEYGPE